MPDKKRNTDRNPNKYDDWLCLLCHNHNYAFRNICTPPSTQATAANCKPRNTTPTSPSITRDSYQLFLSRNTNLRCPPFSRIYCCWW